MRRIIIALSVLGAVACSKLFSDAVQCKTDADCAAFGDAVCDTAQGVCAPSSGGLGQVGEGGTGPLGTTSDASPFAAEASIACPIGDRPQAVIAGVDAGAAPDGGAGDLVIAADTTLPCASDWILRGTVSVRAGVTLTIEAGTRVLAEAGASLVVGQGAKLVARGEKDAPIVFTSSKPEASRAPGDWVGLFLVGNAGPAGALPEAGDLPYGGGDATDSSGALRYLRIEYPSLPLAMGGVGSGTEVDYVQVRRSAEDCFGWYGGTVNVKHLACQSPVDDHFQFNAGYKGKAQFLIGQNAPPTEGGHGGIKVDAAFPVIFNATMCGSAAGAGYGMLLRSTPQGHYANTLVTGFTAGVDVRTSPGVPLELVSSVFFGNPGANVAFAEDPGVTDTASQLFDDDNGFDELAWFATDGSKNAATDPQVACFDVGAPVFGPPSAIVANAAVPPGDGFFDTTAAYVGAVKDRSDAWATQGAWVVWAAK